MNTVSHELFKLKKYLLLNSFISEELRDVFLDYANFQSLHDLISEPDDCYLAGTHCKYADFLTEALLLEFQPKIEAFIGEPLFPSYSFYRVYKKGDFLMPHVDRNASEIGITVCFGWPGNQSWPFKIATDQVYKEDTPESQTFPDEEGTILINLEPGDALIFEGTQVKHWRGPLEHEKHVQVFFYYVRANGPYASLKYDGRDNIGAPKVSPVFEYVKYSNWMKSLMRHLSFSMKESVP